MSNTLIEAVARAIHTDLGDISVSGSRHAARAAIAAIEASGTHRVVPVEMTPEMDGAALHANINPPQQEDGSVLVRAQNKHIYAALLAAAPKVIE